jgi:hypothetical protein
MTNKTEKQAAAVAPTGAVTQPGSETSNPSYEEIARLAYSYWEARCCQDGSTEDDWYRAERDIQIRKISTPAQRKRRSGNGQLQG